MKAKGGIFALNDSDEGKSRDLKHYGCTKNMKKTLSNEILRSWKI